MTTQPVSSDAAESTAPGLDRNALQGLGLAGFRKDHQELICVEFGSADGGRRLLASLAPFVASDLEVSRFNTLFSEIRKRRASDRLAEQAVQATWIGVGISAAGLSAIGVDATQGIPPGDGNDAFAAGMAARAEQIGDDGADAPPMWHRGISGAHLMLVVASDTKESLDDTVTELTDLVSDCGGSVSFQESGNTLTGALRGHEYFGFKDGVSQPIIGGYGSTALGTAGTTAIGEFVLGLPDETGATNPVSGPYELGSFLVFRRLTQDVDAFHAQAAAAAATVSPTVSPQVFEAKMVGRWPSGSPLESNPETDPGPSGVSNAFEYQATDDDGHVVPQWAHIRKVNPRDETQPPPGEDVQRHRMIRRGIPFEKPDHEAGGKATRGLHFLTVVADVARQFEFVQKRWMDDPNFPNGGTPPTSQGPYSPPVPGTPPAGPDPVAGHYADGAQDAYVATTGAAASVVLLAHQLVHMTGGEYFLLPSIPTLASLGVPDEPTVGPTVTG